MTNTPIRVRPAGPSELASLVPLFDAYRGFYHQPPDLPKVGRFLEDRLRNRDSFVFLAFVEGEALPAQQKLFECADEPTMLSARHDGTRTVAHRR